MPSVICSDVIRIKQERQREIESTKKTPDLLTKVFLMVIALCAYLSAQAGRLPEYTHVARICKTTLEEKKASLQLRNQIMENTILYLFSRQWREYEQELSRLAFADFFGIDRKSLMGCITLGFAYLHFPYGDLEKKSAVGMSVVSKSGMDVFHRATAGKKFLRAFWVCVKAID